MEQGRGRESWETTAWVQTVNYRLAEVLKSPDPLCLGTRLATILGDDDFVVGLKQYEQPVEATPGLKL